MKRCALSSLFVLASILGAACADTETGTKTGTGTGTQTGTQTATETGTGTGTETETATVYFDEALSIFEGFLSSYTKADPTNTAKCKDDLDQFKSYLVAHIPEDNTKTGDNDQNTATGTQTGTNAEETKTGDNSNTGTKTGEESHNTADENTKTGTATVTQPPQTDDQHTNNETGTKTGETKAEETKTGDETKGDETKTGTETGTQTGTQTGTNTKTGGNTTPTNGDISFKDTQKLVNPNDYKCSSIKSNPGEVVWKDVDGNQVLKNFNAAFQKNALNCEECFGKSKEECESKSNDCKYGIRELATVDKIPRWDTALARFAGADSKYNMQCEVGEKSCDDIPSCEDTSGPGAFVLMKSVTTLHDQINSVYEAIETAQLNAQSQMKKFSAKFAPLPDIKDEALMMMILTNVACGLFGAIPGVGGIAAGTGAGIVSGVIMEEFFFGQPKPADTDSMLGWMAKESRSYYAQMATGLFRDGSYQWTSKDGKKKNDIPISGLLKDGKLANGMKKASEFKDQLVPRMERVLLQQLTRFTWQKLQSDGAPHIPYIVFDNKSCEDVDKDGSGTLAEKEFYPNDSHSKWFKDIKNQDSRVSFEGKCYYLLDAKNVEDRRMKASGRGFDKVRRCDGLGHLPGGTHTDMNKDAGFFSDLSLADFVIPSVRGWLKHDKKNGYEAAGDNGELVNDPQDAGAVNFPICDFLGDHENPGKGCPKIKTDIPGGPNSNWACAVFEEGGDKKVKREVQSRVARRSRRRSDAAAGEDA